MKTDDPVNKKNDLKASAVAVIGTSLNNQKPAIWQEYPCLSPRHAGLVGPKKGFGSLFHKQPGYLHEALPLEPVIAGLFYPPSFSITARSGTQRRYRVERLITWLDKTDLPTMTLTEYHGLNSSWSCWTAQRRRRFLKHHDTYLCAGLRRALMRHSTLICEDVKVPLWRLNHFVYRCTSRIQIIANLRFSIIAVIIGFVVSFIGSLLPGPEFGKIENLYWELGRTASL